MKKRTVFCLLLASCGTAEKSDWERKHEPQLASREETVTLPAYPRGRELLEFSVAATSELRYFIDPASIGVSDGVVRYTLVARSPSGASNVSHEGLRCDSGEVRIYALGRDEGSWAGSSSGWRPLQAPWHRVLAREYFCPQRESIASREEGILALRRGGLPFTRGLTEDIPRGGGR